MYSSLVITMTLVVLSLVQSGCSLPSRRSPIPFSELRSRQYCRQAAEAVETEDWPRAEIALRRAVDLYDEDPETLRQFAEVLATQGNLAESVEQLEKAAERSGGDDPMMYVLIAEKRLLLDQPQPAYDNVQRAIELNPKLAEAWAVRSRILRSMKLPKRALSDAYRALALTPDDPQLPLDIADLLLQQGDPDLALVTLQRLGNRWAADEEPQQILFRKGLTLLALERYDDAVESLASAAQREEQSSEIWCQLAEAELKAGRPGHAESAARRALTIDPSHMPSRQFLQHLVARARYAVIPN